MWRKEQLYRWELSCWKLQARSVCEPPIHRRLTRTIRRKSALVTMQVPKQSKHLRLTQGTNHKRAANNHRSESKPRHSRDNEHISWMSKLKKWKEPVQAGRTQW